MDDPMTGILEARDALERARETAKELVDRHRARLGLEMIQARENSPESQATISAKMGYIGTQQVRSYEQSYREWADKHPGEKP
jgi:hypothetical protein